MTVYKCDRCGDDIKVMVDGKCIVQTAQKPKVSLRSKSDIKITLTAVSIKGGMEPVCPDLCGRCVVDIVSGNEQITREA